MGEIYMSIDRWIENAKGNHVALGDGRVIGTVYQTKEGRWGGVWSGEADGQPQRLKGEYWSAEEVQEIIQQTDRDGMDPDQWYPPDGEWQQAKNGGYYRRLLGSIVSVKQARSGSWYATMNGALIGQGGLPTWFADERAARAAVNQSENRGGGWEWIKRQ
jgi:hypothetical protein